MTKPIKSTAIVVSGLPASGKTTIGKIIADEVRFPLIDKDVFLEQLFEEHPLESGLSRQELSQLSDIEFISAANAHGNAVLISHWRAPDTYSHSGTPTEWLQDVYNNVIEVACVCSIRTASTRFALRKRHSRHGDQNRTLCEIEAWQVNFSHWYPLNLSVHDQRKCVQVSTEREIDSNDLLRRIRILM